MKKATLFLTIFLLPFLGFSQSIHLEEFVVLESYCAGDAYAIVRVLDEDGDEEFTYKWNHNGSASKTMKIYKRDFGKQLCVERYCPCGSIYESCFVFEPIDFSTKKSTITADPITCNGDKDGSVAVNPAGTAPFNFEWNTGDKSQTINGLAAGKYQVTIADAMGCEQVLKTRIKEPRKLRIRPQQVIKNKYFAAVKLKITGGSENYTLNGSKTDDTKILVSFQKKKRYEFELEDENGCISTTTILVKKKFKQKKPRATFAKFPRKKRRSKHKAKCPKV